MWKSRICTLSGLVMLLGLPSNAVAETTISLIWQDSGTNLLSATQTSSNLVLDVMLNADSEGSIGGGLTVDYGSAGGLSVVGFTNNPDGTSPNTLGVTTDTGTQVRNINGFNPFGPIAISSSVRLASITFHRTSAFGTAQLTSLFTATDAIDGVTLPSSLGTAQILPTVDTCIIDKNCSVGGGPPQNSCIALPGQEVTYTYDFLGGTAVIFDDKLGEIGEYQGQTLSRTTTLSATTTNTATFVELEAVCLNGVFQDSVTVTVISQCAMDWPQTEVITLAKGQSAANNAKVTHSITGNIVDPGSLGVTAHRIEVCAGTTVTSAVTDSTGSPINSASGSLSCTAAGCTGTVDATEKYQSVSSDGKDRDSITFLPK